jgi:hypothetical protein
MITAISQAEVNSSFFNVSSIGVSGIQMFTGLVFSFTHAVFQGGLIYKGNYSIPKNTI